MAVDQMLLLCAFAFVIVAAAPRFSSGIQKAVVAERLRELRDQPKSYSKLLLREQFNWNRRKDSKGEIPSEKYLIATQQLEITSKRQDSSTSTIAWEQVRPSNAVGGRTRALIVSHDDPQTLFAGIKQTYSVHKLSFTLLR